MKKLIICICVFLIVKNNSVIANPITQISNSKNKASCVSFTTDEKGKSVMSWAEVDELGKKFFFFSNYSNNTNSFFNKTVVPIEQNTNLHAEGMPKIAFKGDGTIVALFETSNPTEKSKFSGFIKFIYSKDRGKTWSASSYLHQDSTRGTSHSFSSLTRLSNGELGAVWLDKSYDKINNGRSVKFATTQKSLGFVGEKIIDSVACQCCRTDISCDEKGNISIMFRDILADSIRDMSIITSTNNGKTFTKAKPFTNNGWVINGCPHNGPSIKTKNGNIYTTWYSGGKKPGVYYAELNKNLQVKRKELINEHARNIQLCLLKNGDRVLVYDKTIFEGVNVNSKIVIQKINQKGSFIFDITSSNIKAAYPVVIPVSDNLVAVAWSDLGKVYYRVLNTDEISHKAKSKSVVVKKVDIKKVKISNKIDPVCGMKLQTEEEIFLHYKGEMIGFCNESCKEAYQQTIK